jgi:(p)ppGpp synthase/HD superfamily hydrolase
MRRKARHALVGEFPRNPPDPTPHIENTGVPFSLHKEPAMHANSPLHNNSHCRQLAMRLLKAARQKGWDSRRIHRALAFADAAHAGQRRKSGEPFLVHPLEIALVMVHLGAGPDDVIAALLHDTVEDNSAIQWADIAPWGPGVLRRVVAVTKNHALPEGVRFLEAHGRLLQAVSEWGVGLAALKLTDRCHNTATSAPLPPAKLKRLEDENKRFFAPLAEHIGAHGMARFLLAGPAEWWGGEPFEDTMRRLQAPFC